MASPESLQHPLGGMALAFEGCVLWAIRATMGSEVRLKAPFSVAKCVPAGSSLYCILPNGNLMYHAQLVVGLEESEIGDMFPAEPDPKLAKDAIGEIANVISGLFTADDMVVASFGCLRPSTPFFSEGAFTARADWSLTGKVEVNGRELALLFSIRAVDDASPAAQLHSGTDPNREGSPD